MLQGQRPPWMDQVNPRESSRNALDGLGIVIGLSRKVYSNVDSCSWLCQMITLYHDSFPSCSQGYGNLEPPKTS